MTPEPSYFDFLMRQPSGRRLTTYLTEIELHRQGEKLTPDQALLAWRAYWRGVTAAEFARGETA